MPLAAHAQLALAFGDLSWERINSYLDKTYPNVAHISTQDLAKLANVTLLDVRSPEEYEASHIPGAVRFEGWESTAMKSLLANTPKTSTVVVYCSVGVRSAAIAEKLRDIGYTSVKNLRGSIFMWANEDRPVEGKQVPKVHPFNERWGQLLKQTLRLKL